MKYTPRELKGNINVSSKSPIREFFILLGGILGIVIIVYILLGFAIDIIAPRVPSDLEKKLGSLYSALYEDAEQTDKGRHLQLILDDLIEKSIILESASLKSEIPKLHHELDYTVHLIPEDIVNAMALPGGNIIIFSGLIKEVESENELAFVLAHELGHFAHRDHLRQFGRGLVLLVFSAALFGNNNSVTEFLMDSLYSVEMKFSQHQEKMADLWALDLLKERYGHVSGSTDFFEKLSKKDKKARILYYFATHPYPLDRIKILEKEIKKKGYKLKDKVPLDKIFKSRNNDVSESD